MINVTKTYLPPIEDYIHYLKGIWERGQLTNNGPLVNELETRLKEYLGVKHLFLLANGTIALQVAIKALGLHGDILTTPFSYVATTSSIVWEGCRPVFVDIHPETLTMDPDLIDGAITPAATGILATHVYGYPCAVERIQEIAEKHALKVIYDAAHAFGVRYKGKSLLDYGDISTLSFHATKLFHTGEGGAIVTNNDDLAQRIKYMMNFGHKGQEEFWGLGVNGKNSELHAALGLSILPYMAELISRRQEINDLYDNSLVTPQVTRPQYPPETVYNYAYYPVIFKSQDTLLEVKNALNKKDIFPRRYFYPALSKLPYIPYVRMRVSEDISTRILCLPLSNYLTTADVRLICDTVNSCINSDLLA